MMWGETTKREKKNITNSYIREFTQPLFPMKCGELKFVEEYSISEEVLHACTNHYKFSVFGLDGIT